MITEERKDMFRKFRRWAIIQKFTLQRGYVWMQIPLLGVIASSTLKSAFPRLIDRFTKFLILTILAFIGLYFVGWIDRKLRFLHDDNAFTTETNPVMMEVVEDVRKKEGKK